MIGNLLQENEKLIVYLVDSDVAILNSHGICLASSDSSKIGQKINLPHGAHRSQINEGVLLVYADTDQDSQSPLFNNLIEMTIEQFFATRKLTQLPIDQYLAHIIQQKGHNHDLPSLESQGKSLGLNFAKKRVAIAISLKNFEENLLCNANSCEPEETIQNFKRAIATSIGGFFTQTNELITAYVGNDKFVVLKTVDSDNDEASFLKNMKKASAAIFGPLTSFHNDQIIAGFSNAHSEISGFIEIIKEAFLALEAGEKFNGQKNGVYYFGDLRELKIIAEEDNYKKVEYANEIINRLKNPELKRTLETFFKENLNLTNTATKLGIHPNTVTYRLNRIEEILGLDPRIFNQANAIQLALLTNKLLG